MLGMLKNSPQDGRKNTAYMRNIGRQVYLCRAFQASRTIHFQRLTSTAFIMDEIKVLIMDKFPLDEMGVQLSGLATSAILMTEATIISEAIFGLLYSTLITASEIALALDIPLEFVQIALEFSSFGTIEATQLVISASVFGTFAIVLQALAAFMYVANIIYAFIMIGIEFANYAESKKDIDISGPLSRGAIVQSGPGHDTWVENKELLYPERVHGLEIDEHGTLTKEPWIQYTSPHYYSIRNLAEQWDVTKDTRLKNDTSLLNRIVLIHKGAFYKKDMKWKQFTYPPRLNYIGDDAFRETQLTEFNFAAGNDLSTVGASAFQGTQLPVIDLIRHLALVSIGSGCFSENPSLNFLRLPPNLLGMGGDIVKNTPNLSHIHLSWLMRHQLKINEKNSPSSTTFRNKKLLIPPSSFEQYYRYSDKCKFLGGDFLLEENNPVIQIVDFGQFRYLTMDNVLKAFMDNLKDNSKEIEDEEKRKKAADTYKSVMRDLSADYWDSRCKDERYGMLYEINILNKKARILSNVYIKDKKTLTITSNKTDFAGNDYTFDYLYPGGWLPNGVISQVTVDMETAPDSMFSRFIGTDNQASITFTDKVKTIGRGVCNGACATDVHFNWHTERAIVHDQAFNGNVRLHVLDYTGRKEDFNYFAFMFSHYKGGLIMPPPGMKMEDISRRTLNGLTYEYPAVNSLSSRVVEVAGEHVVLPNEKEIDRRTYPVSFILPDLFRGNRTVKTVKLPASTASLPDRSFEGCEKLESVACDATHIASIGAFAFSGCRSLKEIVIPATVQSIGESAFDSCANLTSLSLLSSNPPVIDIHAKALAGLPSSCQVHIPKGSEENYGYIGNGTGTVSWQGYTIAPNYYAVATEVNVESGSVSGNENRSSAYGRKLTLTAHSGEGYHFVKWMAGSDSISAEKTATFTVKKDTVLQAHFALNSYRMSLSAVNGSIASGEGSCTHGAEVTAKAVGDKGYYFVKWTNAAGDSVSAENPFVFTAKSDMTLQAHFSNLYRVSLSAAANGRIASGDGVCAYGTEVTARADTEEGYRLVKWTNAAGDSVSAENPLVLTVEGDTTLRAHFSNLYRVSLSAAANGRIASGDSLCVYGTAITAEAEAEEGYHLLKWTNAAGDSVSAENPTVFTVKDDTTLQAHFVLNSYKVGLSATEHGRVTSGEGIYTHGVEAVAVAAVADSGYHFVKWVNAGGDSVSVANPYRFAVKGDAELTAVFAVDRHLITVDATRGGQALGGGYYDYGTLVAMEAVPHAGYVFTGWMVGDSLDVLSSDKRKLSFALTGKEFMTYRAVFAAGSGTTGSEAFPAGAAEARVYYADGVLRLANLGGYSISIATIGGERVLQFMADSDDAEYAAALPAGVYVLNGAKWKERYVVKKFVVR
ncbi:hypothetical protein Barb7_01506 [Bacteroidales bacterium Barb7]|nr:hypothetical protein Barb7_01506 [Bacteroidales bacterium Barb7]